MNKEIEDISTEVLSKLVKMVDVDSQARNIFTIDGQKNTVSLTSTGLVIHNSNNNGLSAFRGVFNIKCEINPIEYQDIFRVKCHFEGTDSESKSRKTGWDVANRNVPNRQQSICNRQHSLCHSEVGSHRGLHGLPKQSPNCMTLHYAVGINTNIWKCKQVTLRHEDTEVIQKWSTFIQQVMSSYDSRPKQLLVFVNPFGGKGLAKSMYNKKIAPLFKMAGINCKVVVTERANHAKDMLQTIPLENYDGVISVGGDGMFAEVFNGVVIRTARDQGLEYNDDTVEFVRPKIRVGFIPGGSTDAIAMCLHGTTDPVTAALHIILGDRLQADSVSIHSQGRLQRISMTMVSYGYFGDLMLHSERFRWLGPQRYDVSGIRTFLKHEVYDGSITYKVASPAESLRGNPCGRDCNMCVEEDSDESSSSTIQGQTKHISGRFLAVSSATLTCSCKHTPAGMSPNAHTGDGATDLIIVHKTSRINYFRYLFRTAFNLSSPFKLNFVEANRVKSFTFKPKSSKSSVWSCDGEILDSPEICVKVHKQLIPIFARGIYNKKAAAKSENKKITSEEAKKPDLDFFKIVMEPDVLCVE